MRYELLFLVGASKEPDMEKIRKEAYEIIESYGGTFEEKEVVEKRKLAYPVRHETHGTYIARRFELEDIEKIGEITRKFNLHTGILRSMISKASELPELRTKEERMGIAKEMAEKAAADIAQKESQAVASKTEKPASAKEEEKSEPSDKPEEKPAKKASNEQEDIDKKIEEILNI